MLFVFNVICGNNYFFFFNSLAIDAWGVGFDIHQRPRKINVLKYLLYSSSSSLNRAFQNWMSANTMLKYAYFMEISSVL